MRAVLHRNEGNPMKYVFCLGFMCFLAFPLSVIKNSLLINAEDEIKKLEAESTQAYVKDGAAAVEKYEADDMMSIDAMGMVPDKFQDRQAFLSGDTKIQSIAESDVKVRAYGNTAVAVGIDDIKATSKGQDISAKYRFSDVWVKRSGKWQIVSSQVTKIQQ
jgi:ketosteroid isomerase-like protein